MTIHLLAVEHRHGIEHWACATEEAARDCLDGYVQQCWQNEMGEEPEPETAAERIDRYFGHMDHKEEFGFEGESYSIDVLEVHGTMTPPYRIYDDTRKRYLPGEYETRAIANEVCEPLNAASPSRFRVSWVAIYPEPKQKETTR